MPPFLLNTSTCAANCGLVGREPDRANPYLAIILIHTIHIADRA